jgi:phage shock protein C
MKRLYRSRTDRMVAGVCGGIAQYFDVDPTLVRLAFVAFTLAGGSGVLAYVILAIIMPLEPVSATLESTAQAEPSRHTSATEETRQYVQETQVPEQTFQR